jgi:hypothetical protein
LQQQAALRAVLKLQCTADADRSMQATIPNELAQQKVFLAGPDNQGCACCILLASKHIYSHETHEENKRLCV